METNAPGRVIVRFCEESGVVDYAKDLARLMRIPLIAYTPISRDLVDEHARIGGVESSTVRSVMHVRMQVALYAHDSARMQYTEVGTPHMKQNDILVSCTQNAECGVAYQLSPAGEHHVFRTNVRELFVPIGDGPSALYGAQVAIMLARELRARVCLWHTTWRHDEVESDIPADHALPFVKGMIERVRMDAESVGVEAETVIECAPRLVEGLVTTALSRGSALIVMAQGTHKRFGTYTERVRARNCPIPLLVAKETR